MSDVIDASAEQANAERLDAALAAAAALDAEAPL